MDWPPGLSEDHIKLVLLNLLNKGEQYFDHLSKCSKWRNLGKKMGSVGRLW